MPMLKVYYDGLCHLCGREMSHYAGLPGIDGRVEFVDIADPGFDPIAEGVDPIRVHTVFHAKRPDGRILVGLDAFRALWRASPGYGWLAALTSLPVIDPVLRLLYRGFAEVRPLLPKRKTTCPLRKPAAPGRA